MKRQQTIPAIAFWVVGLEGLAFPWGQGLQTTQATLGLALIGVATLGIFLAITRPRGYGDELALGAAIWLAWLDPYDVTDATGSALLLLFFACAFCGHAGLRLAGRIRSPDLAGAKAFRHGMTRIVMVAGAAAMLAWGGIRMIEWSAPRIGPRWPSSLDIGSPVVVGLTALLVICVLTTAALARVALVRALSEG